MKITIKARAKINLSLEILGKMQNGYHDLLSIMQSVDICDTITIEKTTEIGAEQTQKNLIEFACSIPSLNGEDNLCYKAAEKFYGETRVVGGCKIFLEKNIPMEAGMAGGSTDAAAVLAGLNQLYDFPIAKKRLHQLAKELGADVPFCLYGGTCKAEGIGDVLTHLSPLDLKLLIVKPPSNVSTRALFAILDKEDYSDGKRTQNIVQAIEKIGFDDSRDNNCLRSNDSKNNSEKNSCDEESTEKNCKKNKFGEKNSIETNYDDKNFSDRKFCEGENHNTHKIIYENMFNGMICKSLHFAPEMEEIIEQMNKFGCKKALMSGSGSTVFGIFEDEGKLDAAEKFFSSKYEKVFRTKTAKESLTFCEE